MDNVQSSLDWSLLRSFLAVAQTGSLSAAARQLKASQPTIGRHIQAIEAQLGLELFQRQAKGLNLTQSGAELLPYAQAMEQAAQGLALTASGHKVDLGGTVRVTASVFVAHHILPPILADLHHKNPAIDIEVVASDRSDNLLFREADIAIRMYRPTQLDLVAHHLGHVSFGVYAAHSYLDQRDPPSQPAHLIEHDLIGFDRDETIVRAMRENGLQINMEDFALRTDHPTVYWELVRAGCGIGFCQTGIARHDPTVKRLLPNLSVTALDLWITAPKQTRNTPRISKVWDHLKQQLKRQISATSDA